MRGSAESRQEQLDWVSIVLRVFLGALWLWAGVLKMVELDGFVEVVSRYEIAPFNAKPWDQALGYFLPGLEILMGLCLIVGVLLRGAALLSLMTVVGFAAATVHVQREGLNIECGCFGQVLKVDYAWHLVILAVMALAAIGILWRLQEQSPEGAAAAGSFG